jgi:hypothetical protein
MRDMFPFASGAWHAPHLLMTSSSFTGKPSSMDVGGDGFAAVDDGGAVACWAELEGTLNAQKNRRERAAPE